MFDDVVSFVRKGDVVGDNGAVSDQFFQRRVQNFDIISYAVACLCTDSFDDIRNVYARSDKRIFGKKTLLS